MFDLVINYMDKFGPEILVIQFGFLVIISTIFLWLWFSNRRKYHNLKHAIPANIVKSYLDSIIQNSTSLKSQLFRGGGLEVSGVPSVIPLQNLMGGDGLAVSGAPSTALLEELNQRKAQVAALESQLSSSQSAQSELDKKLGDSQGNLTQAQTKIKELEALLAKGGGAAAGAGAAAGGGGGDAALKAQLTAVTAERDDLRDRLKEFEIISDDLANLKRLKQENEQLKKSLAGGAGAAALEAAAPAPAAEPAKADVSDLFDELNQAAAPAADASADANSVLEDFLAEPVPAADKQTSSLDDLNLDIDESTPAPVETQEAAPAATAESDDKPKSGKSPDDLLSEFEKMLG